MKLNPYEATFVTFCEALQRIMLEDKKRLKSRLADGEDYDTGYMDGLYRVLTLLEQQAEPYGLTLKDIGFDRIEPGDLLAQSADRGKDNRGER